MNNNKDYFEILRKIKKNPKSSQRELANELGFSLGKLNYCIKALNQKGLIKIINFSKKENKISYFHKYILTTKGIKYRLDLTIIFMKNKMKEYEELKAEINEK
jgi:EPS-associated MarR family transcriptional regulator